MIMPMNALLGGPIPFEPRPEPQRRYSDAPFVGLAIGAGVVYGLDSEHAGKLIIRDTIDLDRPLLEASPAVNIASRVISRLIGMIDMKLTDAAGNDYNGRGTHPVLRLWNEAPNEFQTAREFRGLVGQEIVYTGELIARIDRDGLAPRRLYLWDASRTFVEFLSADEINPEDLRAVKYQYGTQSFALNPDLPQAIHVRQNPHPQRILRGRPAVFGMRHELLANIYATLYRNEVFRQGGPPRLALEADDEMTARESLEDDAIAVASRFTQTVKTPQSYRQTPFLPAKVKVADLGPKGTDPLMISGARHTDEKILAAYGVPVNFANNLERATYSNVRSEDRKVVRDAVAPILELIGAAFERDLLRPMGGVSAKLKVGWDLDKALEAEAVIWNKVVLDRKAAGVISLAEAREELGYDPADSIESPAPDSPAAPRPDAAGDGGDGEAETP